MLCEGRGEKISVWKILTQKNANLDTFSPPSVQFLDLAPRPNLYRCLGRSVMMMMMMMMMLTLRPYTCRYTCLYTCLYTGPYFGPYSGPYTCPVYDDDDT